MSTPDFGEFCSAHGCPMIAALDRGGRWFCCCHWRAPNAAFDAITAELNRNRGLVDAANLARRTFAGYLAIRDPENLLIELTHVIGQQYALVPRTGPILGPTTHAPHHASGENTADMET